ncbi:hypothetical protein HK104_005884, partial [Borealophlyctis nickersoniae]
MKLIQHIAFLVLLLLTSQAKAQQAQPAATTSKARTGTTATSTSPPAATTTFDHPGDAQFTNITTDGLDNSTLPDVYLNVPNLSVDLINLTVTNLEAHVALKANVANLVSIQAGVDVSIANVQLTIQGVKAQLLLEARLKNVYRILARTLDTLDKNPNILSDLVKAVDGLLSSVTNTLGQIVQTVVDATGNILQKTVDETGKILSNTVVGNVLDLPLVGNKTNEFGQTVQVRK